MALSGRRALRVLRDRKADRFAAPNASATILAIEIWNRHTLGTVE